MNSTLELARISLKGDRKLNQDRCLMLSKGGDTLLALGDGLGGHPRGEVAAQLLCEALALAEPGGCIRVLVDEGPPMARLLSEAAAQGLMPDHVGKLLAVLEAQERRSTGAPDLPAAQPLIEPLSQRELEVLELIAQGLSNREIGERLYLALDTVKGHNRRIFGKLQVQRRTEAVARARELGLI